MALPYSPVSRLLTSVHLPGNAARHHHVANALGLDPLPGNPTNIHCQQHIIDYLCDRNIWHAYLTPVIFFLHDEYIRVFRCLSCKKPQAVQKIWERPWDSEEWTGADLHDSTASGSLAGDRRPMAPVRQPSFAHCLGLYAHRPLVLIRGSKELSFPKLDIWRTVITCMT